MSQTESQSQSSNCSAIILTVIIGFMLVGFLYMWCSEPAALQPDNGSSSPSPTNNVLELTAGDVAKFSKNVGACIMFYADWCPHCTRMKPNYITAAAQCPNATFAVLNDNQCRGENSPCTTYGVRGYPTVIKFIGSGEFETYSGDRTVASLVAFCRG